VSAASKDLQLEKVKVVNGVPAGLEVFADPLIVKVFRNLIQNTLRHGGSVTTIHFYHEEQDGVRFLVCEDDGVGISADMKRKLFTKGFGKDHGLGLYLSREILSITGIVITEEGESGKGAKFVMTMPHNGLREN
jgi:signal transduction histidine kinase